MISAARAGNLRPVLVPGSGEGHVRRVARKLTDEQAFQRLRAASQQTHRKLRDLADDIIYTGRLDV
jgi:hypothetical protein